MKHDLKLTSGSVQQVVNDLNAGWRNEVVRALGMDSNTFQMAQGTLGLQSADSSGLFLMADSVPPQSTTAYYDPSGKNKRSSAYNQMLHAMLPSTSSGLRAALGDQYSNWIAYRNADTSDLSQFELFKKWASRRLDPNQETAAITAFKMTLSDPLNVALSNYVDKNFYMTFTDDSGKSFTLPSYSCTIDAATKAINTGGSASIDYDSTTASTSSNGTMVSGSASGFYDIFSASAGGSFEQLNQTAASSAFTIKGTIGKYATVVSDAAEWYDGSMVSRAYNGKNDNTIWDPNSNMGTWDSFFGANGSLARRMSSLLVVSEYDLVVTSKATYSQADFQQIKAQASFGIWPFFSASASATHTETYTLNEDGSLSVRYQLNKGLIAIWGATIQNAPN
ncbi:hypothetical protein SAMCCGM7_pC0832 (plasmid) [Sinorhizobium americanum CCGM7]|uniref:hypothetical protein n=1 Tax=Sinorhizobium americanum TaxID=194963 RepID=UPI0004D7A43B|nr:hypothetical protein [Sinorhizobium americanum]APG88030.1 hypothetical protein SAMCCGM7_pC0832 [Sinorhizobium americanum CCGM7]